MGQRAFFRLAGIVCAAIGLAGCGQVSDENAFLNTGNQPQEMQAKALMGSTPTTLDAEFGKPVLLRVDGTAQVWLYHSAVCGLNLILYPDRAGVPRVADAVQDNGDPASCMASLQRGTTDAALEPPASS
jgi:hypothetical protein